MSIPSYHAYNHHYFGWLTGKDAVLNEADSPTLLPNPTTTQFETAPGVEHGYPTNIVFKVTSISLKILYYFTWEACAPGEEKDEDKIPKKDDEDVKDEDDTG